MDATYDSNFYEKDFVEDTLCQKSLQNYSRNVLSKSGGGSLSKLNPWYVTGFTDAEGSFSINTTTTATDKLKVGLQYKVTQLASSEGVLHDLVEYFKTGKVHIDNRSTGTLKYQVQDLASIRECILPHFQEYPLQTSKALDYKDWSKAVDLLTNKWHYQPEGKQLLLDIKQGMNNARPKAERWDYLNGLRDIIKLYPNWVQGFIDGEGSFQFRLADQVSRNSHYIAANPTLEIAQSNHDVVILEAILNFLDSGYVKPKFDTTSMSDTLDSRSVSRYVTNNEGKVTAFLDDYPLKTLKQLDYIDWKKLIDMKNEGLHKTEEGRAVMEEIKSKMNRYRK